MHYVEALSFFSPWSDTLPFGVCISHPAGDWVWVQARLPVGGSGVHHLFSTVPDVAIEVYHYTITVSHQASAGLNDPNACLTHRRTASVSTLCGKRTQFFNHPACVSVGGLWRSLLIFTYLSKRQHPYVLFTWDYTVPHWGAFKLLFITDCSHFFFFSFTETSFICFFLFIALEWGNQSLLNDSFLKIYNITVSLLV